MQRGFEWRADLGQLRWLLLGTLGVAASACGGRATDDSLTGESGQPPGPYDGTSPPGLPRPPDAPGGPGGTPVPGQPTLVEPQPGPPYVAQPTFTPLECLGPIASSGGGWQYCSNGIVHRPSISDCVDTPPRDIDYSGYIDASGWYGGASADPPYVPDAGGAPFCVTAGWCCRNDNDCTALPHGYCEVGTSTSTPHCVYGCVSDSECGPEQACLCGNPVGRCVAATCSRDTDCPGTFLCTAFVSLPGCGGTSFACQTARDQCVSESDCGTDAYCTVKSDGARACSPPSCVIGRPFLVDGRERLAPPVLRDDWYASPLAHRTPGGLAMSTELRAAVHRGWLDQALMEHASVAAFARFSLQLASLGAPPELLLGAASAMQDEIQHARACFELARRHSDTDVGPGLLPIAGALGGADLASIVLATITEGCIGETVAALEATEALAHTIDPLARTALERIARDEAEHARLAWRFVQWALDGASRSVRAQMHAAFRRELERPAPRAFTPTDHDTALLEHGLLPEAARQALRHRVLREVIAPCAEALQSESDELSAAAA